MLFGARTVRTETRKTGKRRINETCEILIRLNKTANKNSAIVI